MFQYLAKIETPDGTKELEIHAESDKDVVEFLCWSLPRDHKLICIQEDCEWKLLYSA